jgi:ferritin-like metal-binding protein YciE
VAGDLNQRDARLVQWLQEAHTKEAELEADLTQHIGLTQKASYKKRLQDHLKETRDHKRRVERRLKQLGGAPGGGSLPGPVGEVAGKTVSLVKGQIGVARAAVTEQVETHLRNAQEELREEHVEIALYSRLETLASEVGDRDTAQLAKAIRRDEERMAKFLDAELTRLVKDVVRADIPRGQRAAPGRSRRSTRRSTAARRSGSSATRSRSSSSRSSGSRGGGGRTSGSRNTQSRPRTTR